MNIEWTKDTIFILQVVDTQKAAPDSAVVLENRLQEAKSDLSQAENSKYEDQEKYDSWALEWTKENGREVTKKDVYVVCCLETK